MYAVIASGGKQERVEVGSQVNLERLAAAVGDEVDLQPVLIVDGAQVHSSVADLGGFSVQAKVLGATKGPKIVGFTYKPKTRGRRHFGHRQGYTMVEITSIAPSDKKKA